jgi:hypothetical protein
MKKILTEEQIINIIQETLREAIDNNLINEYNLLTEEQLNEGFKDFLKKFALTAAIATSCLTAAAKPAEQYVDNNKLNKEIVQKEKDLVKFGYAPNTNDIHLIIKSGAKTSVTQAMARQEFYVKTVNQGINAKILKTEYFKNAETGENVVVLYYTIMQ